MNADILRRVLQVNRMRFEKAVFYPSPIGVHRWFIINIREYPRRMPKGVNP